MLPPIEVRGAAGGARAGSYKVVLSNVSPSVTDEALRTFFTFAGPVDEILLSADVAGATQNGTISFLTAQGAETALLLDGALLGDRPINIHAPAADADKQPLERLAASREEEILLADDDGGSALERNRLSDHGGQHRLMGTSGLPGGMPQARPAVSEDVDDDGEANAAADSSANETITALLAAGYKLGQRAIDFVAEVRATQPEATRPPRPTGPPPLPKRDKREPACWHRL
jgi:hypothetical protein